MWPHRPLCTSGISLESSPALHRHKHPKKAPTPSCWHCPDLSRSLPGAGIAFPCRETGTGGSCVGITRDQGRGALLWDFPAATTGRSRLEKECETEEGAQDKSPTPAHLLPAWHHFPDCSRLPPELRFSRSLSPSPTVAPERFPPCHCSRSFFWASCIPCVWGRLWWGSSAAPQEQHSLPGIFLTNQAIFNSLSASEHQVRLSGEIPAPIPGAFLGEY